MCYSIRGCVVFLYVFDFAKIRRFFELGEKKIFREGKLVRGDRVAARGEL